MISGVKPKFNDNDSGVGLELLLHNAAFFAAATMCHYELAPRPPQPAIPHDLLPHHVVRRCTRGGIFNSLIAPVVFLHAYEYRVTLNLACLMVPHLNPLTQDDKEAKMTKTTALAADAAVNLASVEPDRCTPAAGSCGSVDHLTSGNKRAARCSISPCPRSWGWPVTNSTTPAVRLGTCWP